MENFPSWSSAAEAEAAATEADKTGDEIREGFYSKISHIDLYKIHDIFRTM
jgi:hypothetical protein